MKKLLLALATVAAFAVGSVVAKEHCSSCKPCGAKVIEQPKPEIYCEKMVPVKTTPCYTKNVSWVASCQEDSYEVKRKEEQAEEKAPQAKKTRKTSRASAKSAKQ